MKNEKDLSINNFARGGQFLNNFAVMIHQNFVIIVFGALIVGVLSTNIYVEKFTENWERTLYIQEQVMKIEEVFAPESPREVRIETGEGQYTTRLTERFLVPNYTDNVARIGQSFKIGGIIGILTSLLTVLLYIWMSMHLGDKIGKDKHLRGSKLTNKNTLIRLISAYNRTERKRINYTGPSSYKICDVEFPLNKETQHAALIGSTGSGKTQSLSDILAQIKEKHDRGVIYDKMCSFVSRFYNPKTDIILNPLDERAPVWDIFEDCRTLIDWTNIASIIWPDDDKNVYFVQAARQVFAFTAIRYVERCNEMSDKITISGFLHCLMNVTDTELHDLLIGTPGGQHIDPEAQKQTAGVLGTINNGLRSFGYLKDTQDGQEKFSIRKWVEDEDKEGLVFLTSRANHHAALKPLLTMWIAIFVNSLQSQQRSNERKVWFFLDELPSLGKLDVLENALAEARQYGACFVIGTQTISQLRKIYGPDGADTILALTRTKIIFNSGDYKTAEYCTGFIGNREINQKSTSFTMGRNAIRDGQGINEKNHLEKNIMPEELTQLPDLHCILCFPGSFPVAPIIYEYLDLNGPQPTFIEDPLWVSRVTDVYSDKKSREVRKEKYKQQIEAFHSERQPNYSESFTQQEDEANKEPLSQFEREAAPLSENEFLTVQISENNEIKNEVNITSQNENPYSTSLANKVNLKTQTLNEQPKEEDREIKEHINPITGEITTFDNNANNHTDPNDKTILDPEIPILRRLEIRKKRNSNQKPNKNSTSTQSSSEGFSISPYSETINTNITGQNTMPYEQSASTVRTRSGTVDKTNIQARRLISQPTIHQDTDGPQKDYKEAEFDMDV